MAKSTHDYKCTIYNNAKANAPVNLYTNCDVYKFILIN